MHYQLAYLWKCSLYFHLHILTLFGSGYKVDESMSWWKKKKYDTQTNQPQQQQVKVKNAVTMQCSAGKPWVLALMWSHFDKHHPPKYHCRPSSLRCRPDPQSPQTPIRSSVRGKCQNNSDPWRIHLTTNRTERICCQPPQRNPHRSCIHAFMGQGGLGLMRGADSMRQAVFTLWLISVCNRSSDIKIVHHDWF